MGFSDYKKVKQLGEGGNGWVYLMKDKSNDEVAVKISKIKEVTGEFSKLKLERFKTEQLKCMNYIKKDKKE